MSNPTQLVSAADVRKAAETIKDAVEMTPMKQSRTLSAITGADIFLKFEIFQFTAAYKERGALNRLLALSAAEKKRGIIAMSAGNHAQGVSYHATRLGIPATIVMPFGTPFNKVKRTEELGATVILKGNTLEEATTETIRLQQRDDLTFIHPFDDPLVIAGQGTVALEMLAQVPDLDILLIPVGGGGLIAGMATIAKDINSDITIIGVQTESFPSMQQAMKGGSHSFDNPTIAEGIAVKIPGTHTQKIVKDMVDDILIIPETSIEEAIVLMMEIEKVVIEGAGATGLAALMQYPDRFKGKRVGMVLTGGNIDSRLLASAIMRGMARDGRLSRLRVTMLDVPGSLAKVSAAVAAAGANVLELRHQREFGAVSLKMTEMEMVVEAKDKAHSAQVITSLEEAGFTVSEVSSM